MESQYVSLVDIGAIKVAVTSVAIMLAFTGNCARKGLDKISYNHFAKGNIATKSTITITKTLMSRRLNSNKCELTGI